MKKLLHKQTLSSHFLDNFRHCSKQKMAIQHYVTSFLHSVTMV